MVETLVWVWLLVLGWCVVVPAVFILLVYGEMSLVVGLLDLGGHLVRRAIYKFRARPVLRALSHRISAPLRRSLLFASDVVEGEYRGLRVRVDCPSLPLSTDRLQNQPRATRIRVHFRQPLPKDFRIEAKSDGELAGRKPTHDFDFDQAYVVMGRSVDVAARLDPSARNALLGLPGGVTAGGQYLAYVHPWMIQDPGQIVRLLDELIEVVEHLSLRGASTPDRLLENVEADQDVRVRRRSLELLLELFPKSQAATVGLELAKEAPERALRFSAALRVEGDWRPFLEDLVFDPHEATDLRKRALTRLATAYPKHEIAPILAQALEANRPALRLAAARHIARLSLVGLVPALVKAGERGPAEVTSVILRGLARLSTPEAEPFVQNAFRRGTVGVRIEAAIALARLGTPTSIPILRKVAQSIFQDPQVAAAARFGVEQIEERFGGRDPGRLSVVGPGDEGSISFPWARS